LIDDGGWQFGYLGNVDNAIQKIEAFAHDEYNKSEFKNKEAIQERIRSGKDLFGRDLNYTFVELDNSFPEYILLNKERLKHLIR
jgi:beta-1,4-mannosyl-glycoprotein beta-1,4-N-acetylglucosaminyltransferase